MHIKIKKRDKRMKIPPLDGKRLVIPVILRADDIDVGVNPSLRGSARAANRFTDLLRQRVGKASGGREGGGGGGDAAEEERTRSSCTERKRRDGRRFWCWCRG